MSTEVLTLDTLKNYLQSRDIQLHVVKGEHGESFLQMGWQFPSGEAGVFVCLSTGDSGDLRLEIACVSRTNYMDRWHEVLDFLNERNRSHPFARSLDEDGNFWLEYVGFYPAGTHFPESTFNTLFGGVLIHFEEEFAALEGVDASNGSRVLQ
ncbi:YbjN domain-containing protein [Chitinilyticum piscinae]|uniref:YbjN domain-containing protein n=1 Tax=Chitinilyticum piscinae TaxID=2866724 RepID=A0A8J7FN75_9NEIS|nr:YbjN domain-containing protein [Chitinilyticum piscinae]MBE9609766.1 YbjN domain-containing protein [Chitinilyticum piscinae]